MVAVHVDVLVALERALIGFGAEPGEGQVCSLPLLVAFIHYRGALGIIG
jgi:hypothetical protein